MKPFVVLANVERWAMSLRRQASMTRASLGGESESGEMDSSSSAGLSMSEVFSLSMVPVIVVLSFSEASRESIDPRIAIDICTVVRSSDSRKVKLVISLLTLQHRNYRDDTIRY